MEDPRIPTGYGKICRQASENLTKYGHTVYSFAFNNSSPNLAAVRLSWGIVLSNLALSRDRSSTYGDAELIIDACKEFNIDSIIFCNDSHRFAYARKLPKEVLLKSWYWHICEAESQDWLGIELFNRMKGVVFATEYTQNINKDHVRTQIEQIYPSVDLSVFKKLDKKKCRKELKIENDAFVVLRVDRAQPRKKWELTLRSFALLKQQVPTALLYCKCDPHDSASPYNLVEMVEQLKIADSVRFDSRVVEDAELATVYNAADIAFSTTSGEGFGFFQAESLACGVPQIVTNASVCPEICGGSARLLNVKDKEINSETGSEHNLIDIQEAVKALKKLHSDWRTGGRIAQKMSDKSLLHAEDTFSPDIVWRKWSNLISKANKETDIWTASKIDVNSDNVKIYKSEEQFENSQFTLYAPDDVNADKWIGEAVEILRKNENVGAVCSREININELNDFEIADFSLSLVRNDAVQNVEMSMEGCFDASLGLIQNNWLIKYVQFDEASLKMPEVGKPDDLAYYKNKYGKKARENIRIILHTDIGRGIGFSTVSEGLAPELAKLGFDVSINDWNHCKDTFSDLKPLIEKAERRYKDNPDWDDAGINMVCHLMEAYDRVRKPYRVGFSFCESTKVRESYLTLCNGMDKIITFSDFCKEIQQVSGFQSPIYSMPVGVREEYFVDRKSTDKFTFMHVGVSQERKQTKLLVEAFVETFPDEDVQLIVKSNDFGRLEWISKYKDDRIKTVYTDKKPLSIDGIKSLFAKANCYVHPSSGEGIGLPIFEAMAAGLPVIYTDWSAPSEYLNEEIAYPLNVEKMVPAYKGAPQAYDGDNGEWALPDKNHLKQLLKHVYTYRDEAQEKGQKARKHVKENLTWKKTAVQLLPLLFKMEEERQKAKAESTFSPRDFVKPELATVKQDDRIEIDIATSDRQDYLASLLMSLRTQTFQNWDVTIVVDDTDESILRNKLVNGVLNMLGNEGHKWRIIKGLRQGPHVSHQKTLSMAEHELICRIDDDVILSPSFLQSLFYAMLGDHKNEIAAVGGVFLNPFRQEDDQTFHPDCLRLDAFQGKVDDRLMNLQIYKHPDNSLKDSEHLYSSFLYRKSCAEAVGGYFMGYSRVGHREETDLTHRMYLSGWKLKVAPSAVGHHFSAQSGGIRIENGAELASSDEQIFQKRLKIWKGIAGNDLELNKGI